MAGDVRGGRNPCAAGYLYPKRCSRAETLEAGRVDNESHGAVVLARVSAAHSFELVVSAGLDHRVVGRNGILAFGAHILSRKGRAGRAGLGTDGVAWHDYSFGWHSA